jgi:HEPN domain-containing protein
MTVKSRPMSSAKRAPACPAAAGLLEQAESGLHAAERLADPGRRYAEAYLSALRAGAAVLAVRARPGRPGSRRRSGGSVWQILPAVAPELGEWAAFFASASALRASIEAGITRVVTERSADDLVRQAGQFVEVSRSLVCHR